MLRSTTASLSAAETRTTFGWVDLVVFLALFGVLWSVLHFGREMMVEFKPSETLQVSTDVRDIPAYAARTLLRMWIAFAVSLAFAVVVGYFTAKHCLARKIIIPALDVGQSVPVLGFLSATIAGFMGLFPGSLLGVECASIFAIFTAQVWNMTFGFYHSLLTIPSDLEEAASAYGLSRWQRFSTVELPGSIHSLIWNSMMSFGGGWFFVIQSEAITVMNKDIKLPGLGSFMATAIESGDRSAACWAIGTMLIVILLTDQLVWRPLLAWADNFKIEMTEAAEAPISWFYNILCRVYAFRWAREKILQPWSDRLWDVKNRIYPRRLIKNERLANVCSGLSRLLWMGVLLGLGFFSVKGAIAGIGVVYRHVSLEQFGNIAWLGCLTMLRVALMTAVATLIWVPVGVWIGFHPKVARYAQPMAQIAASFPVNMTFPFVVGFFVAYNVPMDWGSIFLIAMGTQWYILFNAIAGAMAIPNDLREVAKTYGLRGWHLWVSLILPAIFPYWVTGACTAAGGAWNASIVAEVATWGNTTLKAKGLGAFIDEVTAEGNIALILCSIMIMSLYVVTLNKLLWRRLYAMAETRFHLD